MGKCGARACPKLTSPTVQLRGFFTTIYVYICAAVCVCVYIIMCCMLGIPVTLSGGNIRPICTLRTPPFMQMNGSRSSLNHPEKKNNKKKKQHSTKIYILSHTNAAAHNRASFFFLSIYVCVFYPDCRGRRVFLAGEPPDWVNLVLFLMEPGNIVRKQEGGGMRLHNIMLRTFFFLFPFCY